MRVQTNAKIKEKEIKEKFKLSILSTALASSLITREKEHLYILN